MENLVRDLRFALRTLWRKPVFAAVAILSLALGIGANSAIFSLVNSLLLAPLPGLEEPDQLVRLYSHEAEQIAYLGLSKVELEELGAGANSLAQIPAPTSVSQAGSTADGSEGQTTSPAITGVALSNFSLRLGDSSPQVAFGYYAMGNYFQVLGVTPHRGRFFTPLEDLEPGAHAVAVVSHQFWRQALGASEDAIGSPIDLNGTRFEIVGVAPPGFVGTTALFEPQLWIPSSMLTIGTSTAEEARELLQNRESRLFTPTARLAAGVTVAEAHAEITGLGQQLAEEYPIAYSSGAVELGAVPASDARIEVGLAGPLRLAATILLALVGLVLLIACANVANLLLARAASRHRELSIRLALGAGRRTLIRQMLTESALLSTLGGVAGLVLAYGTTRWFNTLRPETGLPIRLNFEVDTRVVIFTFVVSALAALLFGLAPALRSSRSGIASRLGGTSAVGRSPRRLGPAALVTVQVALSLVLLTSAALFTQSLANAESMDIGLEAEGVLAVTLDASLTGHDETAARQLYQELVEEARTLPGVESATQTASAPMDWSASIRGVVKETEGQLREEESQQIFTAYVGTDYFKTLRTELLRGRPFLDTDVPDHPGVAIINETFAQRLYGGEPALGQRLRISGYEEPFTIVGVAEDGKYRIHGEAQMPFLFLPLEQVFQVRQSLMLRSAGDPAALLPPLRRILQRLDPDLAIESAMPFSEAIATRALTPVRIVAVLAAAFGALGLILSLAGLYGLLSFAVAQRTKEMGLRLALGASSGNLLGLILRQALTLVGLGLFLGLGFAFATGRALSSLLIDIQGTDPTLLTAVALFLLLTTLAAAYPPARRAAKVDPMVSLRQE
ncbi:MAG: ABC transporter permease [Acidobacteriota bacterium]